MRRFLKVFALVPVASLLSLFIYLGTHLASRPTQPDVALGLVELLHIE